MRFVHCHGDDWRFDAARRYRQDVAPKPSGLWLAEPLDDDSTDTWSEWCIAEEIEALYGLQRTFFDVETERLLRVDDPTDLTSYPQHELELTRLVVPDWERISEDYAGVCFPDYSRGPEDKDLMRFWWWISVDCSSACVWDLSAVTPTGAP